MKTNTVEVLYYIQIVAKTLHSVIHHIWPIHTCMSGVSTTLSEVPVAKWFALPGKNLLKAH